MTEYSGAFVAFDVAKTKHAVAVAESGRTGEVRFLGGVENTPARIERTIKKLAARYGRLQVCFEAGPTGYGLYRQVRELGHDCLVVAPALIPKRPGERVKTNRRDSVTLARLHRAGELTGVWVPDPVHEAIRDLVRAREASMDDLRRKRQQLLSFLLRHGRIYSGGGHWTLAHRRWLADQKFEHTAQQIVFQEGIDAIEDAAQRLRRLDAQLAAVVPTWSMAPVVEAYQAMRGASFLVAVTFAAEIGDVRRFETPRQLMAFLGLVPAESSTGDTVRRKGLTLAGNRRARRALVEAAWTYRYPARVSETLRARLDGLPKAVRDIAWKGQVRLVPAIAGSAPPARSCRWSWRRSRARWRRFHGRSAARSHPCRRRSPRPLHKAGGGATEGNSRRELCGRTTARRPSSRPRKAPRRKHGRR